MRLLRHWIHAHTCAHTAHTHRAHAPPCVCVCRGAHTSVCWMMKRLARAGARPTVRVYTPPGLIPYATAWHWQRTLLAQRTAATTDAERAALPHVLLVLQHEPVFTLGRAASSGDLRFGGAGKRAPQGDVGEEPPLPAPPPGFAVHRVERGGKVTYHGPGQLVLYPLLDLRAFALDLHWYVSAVEETAIAALATGAGIAAGRARGLPGVWVGADDAAANLTMGDAGTTPQHIRKIGAVGMSSSKWFTQHGLALNISPDLSHFGHIVPCGIGDREVTSVQHELERRAGASMISQCPTVDDFQPHALAAFAETFECDLEHRGSADPLEG